MHSYLLSLVLILITLILSSGCEPKPIRKTLVPISGHVTIDGEPLTEGSITVWVKDYRPATARIEEDGHYTLLTHEPGDGCRPGTHPVTITSQISITEESMKHLIPAAYGQPETSMLTITVEEPRDDLNIELTWKVDPNHSGPYVEK